MNAFNAFAVPIELEDKPSPNNWTVSVQRESDKVCILIATGLAREKAERKAGKLNKFLCHSTK